ncbi:hypothetical protein [Flammeovirga kamogawensis]|uniref:Tox-REase-7 domain-containing protein n=2 Tax=Flammeovirga kamogawensis TaxID=373891 RepID=A0ABX8H2N3_9BACT|nr:hypothetical protein [Flammeovirga kamogawensis]MBB6460280.1 hypothetical protein [Flammeovirga kamogawensis]QWG10091.1 hypothetical protein KM029_20630 [Flammeovirga kamogawensis]TRX65598.1 hypothetical protein EO216_24060 [Flammeovirga kamogawensis]
MSEFVGKLVELEDLTTENTIKDEKILELLLGELCSDDVLMSTFETNVTLVEEWKLLYENKSKKVRKNSDQILLFSSLDLAAQGYIAKMTDENMSQITTLENFVSSLSVSNLRVDALNDHDYIIPEKFVFYEKTVIPHWTSDKEQTYQTTVTSNYAQVPIVSDWAKEWSNQYDGNIKKSKSADLAVKEYAANSPDLSHIPQSDFERTWKNRKGEIEPIKITLRNEKVIGNRRHDIYDQSKNKAIEVKDYSSHNVCLSKDIEKEALMDIELLNKEVGGLREVEWIFLNRGPSENLRKLLTENNITVTVINEIK